MTTEYKKVGDFSGKCKKRPRFFCGVGKKGASVFYDNAVFLGRKKGVKSAPAVNGGIWG